MIWKNNIKSHENGWFFIYDNNDDIKKTGFLINSIVLYCLIQKYLGLENHLFNPFSDPFWKDKKEDHDKFEKDQWAIFMMLIKWNNNNIYNYA